MMCIIPVVKCLNIHQHHPYPGWRPECGHHTWTWLAAWPSFTQLSGWTSLDTFCVPALVTEPSVSNGLITLAWSRVARLKRVVMTGPPSIVATSANNHSLASHWQQFFSGFFLVTKSKFLSLLTATIHFNGPSYTEYPFVLLEQRGLVRNTKPLKGSKAVFNMELANNITISGSPASVCVHFVEQSLENVTARYGLTFLQLSGIINCSSQAQQKLTCQVW